jgi:hypothetical protein
MPDRYIVQEIVTLGMEVTPGTAVPSTVRLQGVNVDIDTALEVDRFGPQGNLFDSISAPRQEWATGSVSGLPTYTELPYVFSNVFGAATVTTPSGGTLTRRWTWTPSSNTPWTPRTWTIRRGMVGNTAEQAAYGLMTGVGLSFSRTATPELSGDLFAQALDYAAAVVATGMTLRDLIPILPSEVCVYLDPEFADIGTTQLTRDFVAGFEVTDLFGPIWPLDCTLDSFAAHAVLKPGATATLQLGNDTAGREPVTAMRAGDTRFCRIEATSGQQIEAGPPAFSHRLRIDLALKVVDAPSRGDSDGLSTLEWSFGIFDDPDMGHALQITLDTNFAAL